MNSTYIYSSGVDDEYEDKLNKESEQTLLKLEKYENDTFEEELFKVMAFKYGTYSQIPPYHFLLIETVIHVCICAVGYVGNMITCIVIVSDKSMHTTTNIYLFNLAIADLIMLSSGLINYTIESWNPYQNISVLSMDPEMKYGMKGCFFFNWVSDVAVNVSVLTITAFTVERYLAICRPFLARMILTISKAIKLIFLIWIIGTFFGYLIFSQRESGYFEENVAFCFYPDEDNLWYVVEVETFIFFGLPLIVITVLYILIWKQLVNSSKIQKNQGCSKIVHDRSKMQYDDGNNRQILKMLVTVVAVFFFIWASYHLMRLLLLYVQDFSFFLLELFIDIDLILESTYLTVYFLSSAINPIIYNIMSKKFRCAFKKIFNCCKIGLQKQSTKLKHNWSTTETRV